ncbi:MAG: DUF58 domain-containing protein, partial [Gammaproteobacteria bacterium]|nr:DUF58 domain-containing protein [Gammaproteobacteria bacterium]
FKYCDLRIFSFFNLLQKKCLYQASNQFKVYPDYVPVIEYAMLKAEKRTDMMGVHLVNKRGDGLDFLQLREYREGDTLRQIDWKTTSRLNKTISREYQAEKDQSFIFLLDCSHRMNSLEGSLSHFDHVLNAMLLTSYIALKQGDAVGYAAFGMDERRWKKPGKGIHYFNYLLDDIYNLQPTSSAADYLKIAESIPKLHRKHATVILLTNIRDNDTSEIIPAVRYLSKHYQVIVASIKEQCVDDTINTMPQSFEQALTISAAIQYKKSRQSMINVLQNLNLQFIDINASQLPVALANEYLKVKAK